MKCKFNYMLIASAIFSLGAAGISSCSSSRGVSQPDLSGDWVIKEVGGSVVKPGDDGPYLMSFNKGLKSFNATTDCNSIMGEYDHRDGNVTFKNMGMTRMACPNTAVQDSLSRALERTVSYRQLQEGGIGFYDKKHNMVILLGK